jgi:hypothetical protein
VAALIRATCPTCGEVDLSPQEVNLVVCSASDGTDRSFYSFSCTGCANEVKRPADPRAVAVLRAGGVRLERRTLPAEALEVHRGPNLTWDDVLDFQLASDSIDRLTAELTMEAGSGVSGSLWATGGPSPKGFPGLGR